MTKSVFSVVLALVACLAVTATVSAKKFGSTKTPSPKRADVASKDAVSLEIAGPADEQAVSAYQKALHASGLSAKIHANKKKDGKALRVMAAVDKSTDLGPYGKAVMAAVPTKPGQLPPALELVLYAPMTKETSEKALEKLGRVKGVDAKHSTMDVKKSSLRIRISGAEHVTAEDILSAVESAGIAPKLAKEGRAKKT